MGWAYSTNGEKKNAYRTSMRRLEGKKPLGKPRRRLVDIVKIYLR
jgi:hypothetical protein